MSWKTSKPFAPISTLRSINAPAQDPDSRDSSAKEASSMSNATSTPASTSTWATASTASTVSSHTPSKDKSSSQNLPKRSAASSITKTTVPRATNAAFPMTCAPSHASITHSGSASFRLRPAGFLTKNKSTSVSPVFLT